LKEVDDGLLLIRDPDWQRSPPGPVQPD
jgi:hypothetical protein